VITRRRFEPTEESVGEARRFVSEIIFDLPSELRDAVRLMVSELSTNALVHASSGFEVAVERSDAAVTIAISDQGDGTPRVQSPSPNEPHGRGLRIVDTLSNDWGITSSSETGKTVWFRMTLPSPAMARVEDDGLSLTGNQRTDRSDNPNPHRTSPLPDLENSQLDKPTAHHRVARHPLAHVPVFRSAAALCCTPPTRPPRAGRLRCLGSPGR
jgi:anti-sigma regulatory factor (Ser/Thr protein kinase)